MDHASHLQPPGDDERLRAERALAVSEERFRRLADRSADAVWVVRLTPVLEFLYANASMETITGFTREEWRTNPFLKVQRTHPEDRDALDAALFGRAAETTVTTRFRRADDTWVWLEDRRSIVREDGDIEVLQGVSRDVTAERETERALRDALAAEQQAIERIRAVDELKSRFLRGVSHEVRTPLTSVLGCAVTLDAHAHELSSVDVADLHARLLRNARRLDRLLRDLLDVERLARGVLAASDDLVDAAGIVGRVVEDVPHPEHDIELRVTASPVRVEADLLARITHGLVDNVVRHTPPGTTAVVTCRVHPDTDDLELTVADDGPGVPADDREQLFRPFVQGEPSSRAASPGTGIGLAVVRRLAELLGGGARLRDSDGGGLTAEVTLPARTPDPVAEQEVPLGQGVPGPFEEAWSEDALRDATGRLSAVDGAVDGAAEAAEVVLGFVEQVGGRLTAAGDHRDPDLLPVDLAPFAPPTVAVAAPVGSTVRTRLEQQLPHLLDRARDLVS